MSKKKNSKNKIKNKKVNNNINNDINNNINKDIDKKDLELNLYEENMFIDEKNIKKRKILFYGIVFVVLTFFCYLFPYTHDDWAWGSSIGLERLESCFENYNGRWLGNLAVLLLTRSNTLKSIVMALCLVLLLFFINELTENKKLNHFMSLFLLVSIPQAILRQAIVWTSGFTNYVIPVVLIMAYIYFNRGVFDNKYERFSFIKSFLFLILGFSTALFIEHVTLYLIVLAIFVIIYKYFKFKKISFSSIIYLVGSILGAILMFSNSAYSSVASGQDSYRSFGLSNFIINSIESYFSTIHYELIFNNFVLNIVLSICIIIVLHYYLEKNVKYKKLITLFILVLVSFPLYSLIVKVTGVDLFLKYTKYVNGLFSALYFLTVFGSSFFVSDLVKKKKIIFSLCSIIILTVPLFVVTPIGSRCFFPMFILWVWVVLEYFVFVLNSRDIFILKPVLVSGILIFFGYLLLVYGYIFKVDIERINYINENSDESSLVLPKLPYNDYHHVGNPRNEVFTERFKLFYGIDEATDLEFVSLSEWKKMK